MTITINRQLLKKEASHPGFAGLKRTSLNLLHALLFQWRPLLPDIVLPGTNPYSIGFPGISDLLIFKGLIPS
jgi:hypothetical protein